MSRNNEDKVSGVQIVGYGHPTIFVIEDVKAGTVGVMVDGTPWQFDTAEEANRGLTKFLPVYLNNGCIKWLTGRPIRQNNQLVIQKAKPIQHPSQEAFAKATLKTPNVSAGFGQAVVDHAKKQVSLEERVAALEDKLTYTRVALGELNYKVAMQSYRR